jgi:predicted nuclease of predicted toxin-antitoxin system
MPWRPIDVSLDTVNAFMKAFPKASRFIIDENLGPELAPVLRKLGYNATDSFTLKLNGHSDEDVFAAAWRERRILLTQDREFLDDRRFPAYRNPGVVVLPARNDTALMSALVYALPLLQKGRELWEGLKIVVSENGKLTATYRNQDTRAREITHLKLRVTGPPLIWVA